MNKREKVKIILEWSAVFLLMFHDPSEVRRLNEKGFAWTLYCMDEAKKYPTSSYQYHFWWSLRYWSKDGWIGWRRNLHSRLVENRMWFDAEMLDMEEL